MTIDLELTERTARKLRCRQNAGHYNGVQFPRIVEWKGTGYVRVRDWPKPGFRLAKLSDYAEPWMTDDRLDGIVQRLAD